MVSRTSHYILFIRSPQMFTDLVFIVINSDLLHQSNPSAKLVQVSVGPVWELFTAFVHPVLVVLL